jgi:hypothetical protein
MLLITHTWSHWSCPLGTPTIACSHTGTVNTLNCTCIPETLFTNTFCLWNHHLRVCACLTLDRQLAWWFIWSACILLILVLNWSGGSGAGGVGINYSTFVISSFLPFSNMIYTHVGNAHVRTLCIVSLLLYCRVAAYFGLEHNVDPMDKNCVVVCKGPNTRLWVSVCELVPRVKLF